jgi:hypothetical protein
LPSDGGTLDANADGGGTCTDLSTAGTNVVAENAVADTLAPGTGGNITDGTYNLIQVTLYQGTGGGGPTGNTFQGTIRITGTTFERVLVEQATGGTPVESRVSGTITTSDAGTTSATLALTCPTAAGEQLTYTVVDTAQPISLTLSNLTSKESFVFSKLP